MSLDMDALIRNQNELHGRIARTLENLKKTGMAKITAGVVEARLKLVDAYWAKFEANHDVLRANHWTTVSDHDYVKNDLFQDVEEVYILQRAGLVDLIEEFKKRTCDETDISMTRTEGSSRKQLPRIQLPEFSGKFEEWMGFKDMFRSLIDVDPTLSYVEKLHYLRSCLKGEAEQLVRNIPTTAENYERVWAMLVAHYSNKRLLDRSCFASFIALPKLKSESVKDLRRLFHVILQTVGTLEGIGRPVNDCDVFVHLVVEMMDPRSRREWETAIGGTSAPPTYDELHAFLENRLRALEALHPGSGESVEASASKNGTVSRARAHVAQKSAFKAKCSLCSKEHYILSCSEFQQKTPVERKELAAARDLCYNCFGKHRVSDCPSKKSCAACKKRHHSSIHNAWTENRSGEGESTSSLHARNAESKRSTVLLATARVLVTDRYGNQSCVRALVDPGSETSLVTESLVQRLKIPRESASTCIFGVGGQQTGVARGQVSVKVVSRVSKAAIRVDALVLPRITVYGGRAGTVGIAWPHVRDLPLADPDFIETDPIEMLLGAEIYAVIVEDGLRKGAAGTPVAQRTSLGWILSGTVCGVRPRGPAVSHQCSAVEELTDLVAKFWIQEEPPREAPPLSESDRQCEELFVRTHVRLDSGRYMVRLPVSDSLTPSAGSWYAAVRTFHQVERRLQSNPPLRDLYTRFMAEYEDLQHMAPASHPERRDRVFYLPHYGVLKMDGGKAKIRVVFNGSARLACGKSLNDGLLAGPNLLPDLADVLVRWRVHPYVMATDIEKMYRQILVHPDDRDLQRIVWRAEPGKYLREFQFRTVTHGLACAAFLAIRSMHQLAVDERDRFPLAAAVLRRDVYVDDVFAGANTVEEARILQLQLIQLCTAGGFPLRKWTANAEELLVDIPVEHQQGLRSWESEASRAASVCSHASARS